MFSWSLLLALAPDLVPIIVETIMNVERVWKEAGKGSVKKSRVLEVIEAILETRDYFVEGDVAKKSQIYSLVSEAIDFFVSAFNYLGIFKRGEKVDFSPKENVDE